MITPELIERINELARNKKTRGLTEEEQIEQQTLRQTYLKAFRAGLRSQLDQIKFVDQEENPGGEE
jgi:uncharacterized protein YnzC (UPF0291/DUF896 family)